MTTAPFATPELNTSRVSPAETRGVLDRNLYFVKEHVGLFKASSNYDVLDPESGEVLIECREPNLNWFTKMLRFTDYKRMTPFDVQLRTPEGELLVRVSRGFSLLLSTVKVHDGAGQFLGSFKQKLFSIGGRFSVLNERDEVVCELKGKWTGWDFQFHVNGDQLARVTKKWAGIGKELFTSADNYVLEIDEKVPPTSSIRKLILAAVMTIDQVLKE